jgi:hypothetical protein
MARKPLSVPSYRPHKRTGRAIVTVRNHLGARQDIPLPGDFVSPESREEYDRICALVRTNNGSMPAPDTKSADLTVTELVVQFMDRHASQYYLEPGTRTPTRELECLSLAFRGRVEFVAYGRRVGGRRAPRQAARRQPTNWRNPTSQILSRLPVASPDRTRSS